MAQSSLVHHLRSGKRPASFT